MLGLGWSRIRSGQGPGQLLVSCSLALAFAFAVAAASAVSAMQALYGQGALPKAGTYDCLFTIHVVMHGFTQASMAVFTSRLFST